MAQAKRKTATRTAKKQAGCKKACNKKQVSYQKQGYEEKSNMVFVIAMTFLAATLLFADLLMMTA